MCHLFQSTLPNGSDKPGTRINRAFQEFQSTLPNGSDRTNNAIIKTVKISIHAPKRERQHNKIHPGLSPYFNPRSQTGATQRRRKSYRTYSFQSTLPNGSDRDSLFSQFSGNNFNPRSQTGATFSPLHRYPIN